MRVLLIFIFATFLTGCTHSPAAFNEDNIVSQSPSPTTAVTLAPTATVTPTPTNTPTPIPEPEPFEGMSLYYSGQYKVGADIPSGEYIVLSTSGAGYFAVTSDANGSDIIFNDNFKVNSIITVYDDEYVELSRAFAVSSEEFYSRYTIKSDSSGVMLKVGTDIEAGEYKLASESDSGYYCIYSDSRHDDIVSNNNFSGNNYVAVSDGEYLLLSRCFISQ